MFHSWSLRETERDGERFRERERERLREREYLRQKHTKNHFSDKHHSKGELSVIITDCRSKTSLFIHGVRGHGEFKVCSENK